MKLIKNIYLLETKNELEVAYKTKTSLASSFYMEVVIEQPNGYGSCG